MTSTENRAAFFHNSPTPRGQRSLAELRKHSCYGGLRAAISLLFVALIILSVIGAFLQAKWVASMSGAVAGWLTAGMIVVSAWCFLWLARELMFVFIDMADALTAGQPRELPPERNSR